MKTEFTDYCFSWIANLGVVPLLAFFAFRLFPWFFRRFNLLPFVVFVLETMSKLPSLLFRSCSFLCRFNYLPVIFSLVKIIMIIISIAYLEKSKYLWANENSVSYESLILSKGEHKEIEFKDFKKFSVTNHEVISYKHMDNKHKILLKGQKIGFCELIIWKNTGEKTVYRIYVLDKASQTKILQIAQSMTFAGLNVNLEGSSMAVSGELNDFINYDLVMKLLKAHPNKIHPHITISKELRNFVIGEVYYYLLNEYNENIICENNEIDIICRYSQSNPPSKHSIDYLQAKYHIKLIPSNLSLLGHNFKIKIKLIQLEYQNESNLSLGLNQLKGSWSEVFSSGVKSLINKNEIILKENDLSLSTLAEPEIILTLNTPSSLLVGSEIPFKESNNNEVSHTSWKFAGLKVILTLKKEGPYFMIDYKTEFTKPSEEGQIAGSKEHSTALIKLNHPLELFQIGFRAFGKNSSQIPGIGNIPILGHLFKSKSDRTTYKKISALIELTQNEI